MAEVISMENFRRTKRAEAKGLIEEQECNQWTLIEMLEDTIKDIKKGKISPNAKALLCVDDGDNIAWNNCKLDKEEACELLMDVLHNYMPDDEEELN